MVSLGNDSETKKEWEDRTSLPGFTIKLMFGSNGKYLKQVEDLVVKEYAERELLLRVTAKDVLEAARSKAKSIVASKDFLARNLSMVVVQNGTDTVVGTLFVSVYNPVDPDDVRKFMRGDQTVLQRLPHDVALQPHKYLVIGELDRLARTQTIAPMHKESAARFVAALKHDDELRRLGKNEGFLCMSGGVSIRTSLAPKRETPHKLGQIQVYRAFHEFGVTFSASHVNDLSSISAQAIETTKFGPILFKDVKELTDDVLASDKTSESYQRRHDLIFTPINKKFQNGVSATLYRGEALQIYDLTRLNL